MLIIDVKFNQDLNGDYDIGLTADGDIQTVDGFDTAILMSIYCERRALASQVPASASRRGWIGNENNDEEGFEIGSLVWLYEQARLTSDTANGIKSEADAGLEWMLQDNLLNAIFSNVIFSRDNVSLQVDFIVATGPAETRIFELWKNTGVV